MKKTGEWVIDVYDYHNSASPVRPHLEKLGITPVFHDMTREDSARKAVEKMSELDGRTQTPRVYIRRVSHPSFEFKAVLVDPSRITLSSMLRFHEVIS